MKVKICGIKRAEDVEYINEFLPDYAGFIFYSQSKRYISYERAEILKSKLSKKIQTVGVFVNEKPQKIIEAAKKNIINLVQLHGLEDNNYIEIIKSETNLPVIKVFHADKINNINKTKADFVLIDSKDKNTIGGTGKVFDWTTIPEKIKDKLFLAGGINIKNVKEAMKVLPYCLDVNSGVETDGNKDRNKIKEIIEIIKGYNK